MKKTMLMWIVILLASVFTTQLALSAGMEQQCEKGPLTFHGVKETVGWEVKSRAGETLGTVQDFIQDEENRFAFVVISLTGTDKSILVPYQAISLSGQGDHFVLNVNKESLVLAPDWGDQELDTESAERIYRFFGIQPYWIEEDILPAVPEDIPTRG
jgi:hypothetical protein